LFTEPYSSLMSMYYPPMMHYLPTTFFSQKLCGRVFRYIVSPHPLPWDCFLYCTQRQW